MVGIREISPEAYEGAPKAVVREGLGETYANDVRSLSEPGRVLLVAEVDDEVVGFACGYDADRPEAYVDGLERDVGARSLLEKVAVRPEYRGRGIATRLYEARLERLTQPTLAEAWVRTEAPDSTGLLERFGFEPIERFENRWYEESLAADDEAFCPDCGSVCRCDSVVYLLESH